MSWDQLRQIRDENRRQAEEYAERALEPTICPECGLRLVVRESDGARNCPMGHYRTGYAGLLRTR